jgi:tetratricopeptide (TPR) repeat protein
MTKEISTDGGAYVEGDVNISGYGEFVGRDKIVNIHQPQPYRAPLQRPARADHFQDRTAELAHLLTDLQPGAVITLSGPGGMGKSALAAEAVWHLAPEDQPDDQPPARFPNGIFFHSFYNQPAVDAACEQFARSFGLEAAGSPRENARMALAGRRALLILDGAEDADDLPALLDLRDGCGVLITSRDRRIHTGSRTDLPPLPPEDAVVLIRAWAGQPEQNQAPADPAMAEIANLVGHLPMALRLVGSYLDESAENPTDYLAWLGRSPLAALDQGQRRMQSADILLARTVARLSDDERELLAVTGLLAFAPVDAEIIAHALDREVDDLRPAFAQLVRYSLLVRDDEGCYQTAHALVHTYARLGMTPPSAALERLVDIYEQLARDLSSQGLTGYRALDPHRLHLLALMERCHAAESWDALSSLVWAVEEYLDIQGYATERIAILHLGIIAAQGRTNRQEEGALLGNLGRAYSAVGQVTQAVERYTQALSISREIGDRRNEGAHLGNLGLAYAGLGHLPQAINYNIQALAISREIGDRYAEGNHLGSLGNAYYSLGQLPQAITHNTQALVISREIGHLRGEGEHLGSLGIAYYSLGQLPQAIDYFTQALAISREIGDRRNEGAHLGNLGAAYADLGQVTEAIDHFTQALAISREIGDRGAEGNHLGNLGRAYYFLDQVSKAIDHNTQALVISRETGHRQGEGNHLGNLGLAYSALGRVEEAIEHYTQALVIQREIGDRRGEGNSLGNLGVAYKNLGQVEKARTLWQQALAIFEDIHSPNAETVRAWLAKLDGSS